MRNLKKNQSVPFDKHGNYTTDKRKNELKDTKKKIYYIKLIIGILYLMFGLWSTYILGTAFIEVEALKLNSIPNIGLGSMLIIAIIFITYYGILWTVQGLQGKR